MGELQVGSAVGLAAAAVCAACGGCQKPGFFPLSWEAG